MTREQFSKIEEEHGFMEAINMFDVRKVIYTTNAIESLNSTYKKLNRQRSVFPSDTALLKSLYLSTLQATKKQKLFHTLDIIKYPLC